MMKKSILFLACLIVGTLLMGQTMNKELTNEEKRVILNSLSAGNIIIFMKGGRMYVNNAVRRCIFRKPNSIPGVVGRVLMKRFREQ